MTHLEAAQLHLVALVHEADVQHKAGNILTSRHLWELATACAEVSSLMRKPWLLKALSEEESRMEAAP